MSPETEVCPGVAPEWPELARSGPLLASPGWLHAMDGRLGGSTVTLVVREHGRARLAALATVQATARPHEFFDLHHVLISTAPALPLTESSRYRRATLETTAPPPRRWTPSLVVMLPGYECVPVGPDPDDARLVDALVDGAQRWATGMALTAVAFLYLRPDSVNLAAALAARDYTAVPLSVTWDLPVSPDGLAGHLAALPRKRRQEAIREMLRLAEAGVGVHHLESAEVGTDPVLRRLAALRCQLVRKYRGTVDEETELQRLRGVVDDVCAGRAHVLAAVADGEIIGFALFAPWGDTWHCLAVGYDYDDPRSRLAYFATAFYGAIPVAAQAGVRSLGYGQGSASAKRARGCIGTPLTGWVRCSDPDLAAALRTSAEVTALSTAT